MKFNSIANKLLFAYGAIALLLLLAAAIGLGGFQNVSNTQDSVVNKAVPVLRNAHEVTELNSRLSAIVQSMDKALSDQQRKQTLDLLDHHIQAFSPLVSSLEDQGVDNYFLQSIENTVENLRKILDERNDQIGNRIRLQQQMKSLTDLLITNTVELNSMANSLVANAAATTTAVTSSLYDLVEQQAPPPILYNVFDRLVEIDIDALERMYELRQSSASLSQIINRVSKETKISTIDATEQRAINIVSILKRRINEINDPHRKRRAGELLQSMHLDAGPINISNIFTTRRSLLEAHSTLIESEQRYQSEADRLNVIVSELSSTSGRVLTEASAAARRSLNDSRQTFFLSALVALVLMAFILWRYVHHDVIRRLLGLKEATLSIAGGNLDHPVDASGNDEVSKMAQALWLFRDNAIAKEELNEELNQYKDNLEVTVQERTLQLEQANQRLAEEVAQHDVARERAEHANQAKTDFLATISHELRTPLSGALGTLNLLSQTNLSSKQTQYLNAVDTANSLLLNILDNVLGYSQVRAGKIEVEFNSFDLHRLVTNLVSVMEASAREKGNKIFLKINCELPPQLKGDSGKLNQILMNLLGNAAKFTENGEITLSVNLLESSNKVFKFMFEVRDTGIGIETQHKEELFKAFTQADNSISRSYGGVGLGLAICRRLVNKMGGNIELESELNIGTVVRFDLPFGATKAIPKKISKSVVKSSPGRKILVIEDDPTNMEVAQQYLIQSGYYVTTASNGESALTQMESVLPDLALLDISLPGIDGLEVLKRIRKHNIKEIRNMPVIAMSAHVFEEEVQQYLAAGMDGFLGKPFTIDDLNNAVNQVSIGDVFVSKSQPETYQIDSWRRRIIIDGSIIRNDIELLGQEKVSQLLGVFKKSGNRYLEQIAACIAEENSREISNVAHRMKSASGNFGFLRLSALLHIVENDENQQTSQLEEITPLFYESIRAADELIESTTVSQNM